MRITGLAGLGIAAAMAAASTFEIRRDEDYFVERRPAKRGLHRQRPAGWESPNDSGPVIDTTPESKRARRRRLARTGGPHG